MAHLLLSNDMDYQLKFNVSIGAEQKSLESNTTARPYLNTIETQNHEITDTLLSQWKPWAMRYTKYIVPVVVDCIANGPHEMSDGREINIYRQR